MKKELVFLVVLAVLVGGLVAYKGYRTKSSRPAGVSSGESNNTATTKTNSPSNTSASPMINTGVKRVDQIMLNVYSPQDGSTQTSSPITVSGKTISNAEVFVNDAALKADARGNFSTTLNLEDGDNPIVIVANDATGNSSERDLTVYYNAPANAQ